MASPTAAAAETLRTFCRLCYDMRNRLPRTPVDEIGQVSIAAVRESPWMAAASRTLAKADGIMIAFFICCLRVTMLA